MLVSRQIDLGDYLISYKHGGNGLDSTPLLFIHGWGVSTEPYQEILDQLAQHHVLIAPDLPGTADSKSAQPLEDYQSYAKALLLLLDALNIEKAHVIGHSLGGGIAIMMAALAPNRVRSLVLANSTVRPADPLWEMLVRRVLEILMQFSISKLKLQLITVPQVLLHNLLFNPHHLIHSFNLVIRKDLKTLLSLIQAPCLILWTEQDLTTPITVAHQLLERIQQSKLVTIPEGFHEWFLLHPKEAASIITNFINQVEEISSPDLTN
ncbi:alpha/beta fold hydrolase [Leptolyngbya sp. 7M]|uniref:alpha/beta fold hydrolase n=1 Tax=Leptolyngbya sp. 7M TaxID=2812896 RepID=UPI001B8BE145|nr:alpha/beta hydrolase [Leptolyngbya sp. 7M]QYO63636.1 alpha/beta hydrolase [Leptolyngbya sp. 7M]